MIPVAGLLARAAGAAEFRMSDACRVTRSTDAGEDLDPVTWLHVTSDADLVYEGPCRLRTGGSVSAGSQREVAGDSVTQVNSVLSVPVGAARLMVNDRVEFTASVNPNILPLVFTVSGLVPGSQMTAQRVQVTAVID